MVDTLLPNFEQAEFYSPFTCDVDQFYFFFPTPIARSMDRGTKQGPRSSMDDLWTTTNSSSTLNIDDLDILIIVSRRGTSMNFSEGFLYK